MTSKSAITPWRSGRIAEIVAGVRPIIRSASAPTAWTSPVLDVGGDDRRLGDDDPLAGDVHQRVRRPQVDRDVVDADPGRQPAAGGVTA